MGAQTALILQGRGLVIRTHINPDNGKLTIVTCNADANFIGQKDDQIQVHEHDDLSEEDFHRGLRVDAIRLGHFQAQFSTNPEWSIPVSKNGILNYLLSLYSKLKTKINHVRKTNRKSEIL